MRRSVGANLGCWLLWVLMWVLGFGVGAGPGPGAGTSAAVLPCCWSGAGVDAGPLGYLDAAAGAAAGAATKAVRVQDSGPAPRHDLAGEAYRVHGRIPHSPLDDGVHGSTAVREAKDDAAN